MGTFTQSIQIGNPTSNAWRTIEALVEPGVTFPIVTATLLDQLGVVRIDSVEFEDISGRVFELDTGVEAFRIQGHTGRSRVVFGAEGEAVIGASILWDLRLAADQTNSRLVPIRPLR